MKRIAFVNSKWACELNDRQRITLKWLCPSEEIPTCNIAHVSLTTKPDTAKQYPSRVCLSAKKYKDTQKEWYTQTSLAQRVYIHVRLSPKLESRRSLKELSNKKHQKRQEECVLHSPPVRPSHSCLGTCTKYTHWDIGPLGGYRTWQFHSTLVPKRTKAHLFLAELGFTCHGRLIRSRGNQTRFEKWISWGQNPQISSLRPSHCDHNSIPRKKSSQAHKRIWYGGNPEMVELCDELFSEAEFD